MAMGAIAEYIGRILEQVKGRPMYIVREAVGDPPTRLIAHDPHTNALAFPGATVVGRRP